MTRSNVPVSQLACLAVSVCLFAALAACQPGSDSSTPASCVDLALSDLEIAVVESATAVDAGEQPEHCRVAGTIEDSIRFELLLPTREAWNGRFFMGGGGGFVGSVQNSAQGSFPGGTALERGFATSGTDTGHQADGLDGSWALDNPKAEEDFAHRAVHLTAEASKEIIRLFYGEASEYDYFLGCSRGGGQAMIASQRYPEDFDGIVAAAPAYSWPSFLAGFVQTQQAIYPDSEKLDSAVITPSNMALIGRRVKEQCDALDGVEDGFLNDPRACGFDPASLALCEGDRPGEECLTSAQLRAVQTIYDGPKVGGEGVFPGFPIGNEDAPGGWDTWITGERTRANGVPSLHFAFGGDFFKYLVYDDPEWDYTSYDFSSWYDDTRAADALFSANSTDLSAFRDAGGKMIFWHGWSDPAITALGTIDYYEGVESADPAVRDYARLFMLPGVLHCAGGPGPDRADWIGAITDWVEGGEAPESIVASKLDASGEVALARPLCPYPQVATYDGSGDPNSEDSFTCSEP